MGMGDCMVEWVGVTWDEESDIRKDPTRTESPGWVFFWGKRASWGLPG